LGFSTFTDGALFDAERDKRSIEQTSRKPSANNQDREHFRSTYGVCLLDVSFVMISIPFLRATPIYQGKKKALESGWHTHPGRLVLTLLVRHPKSMPTTAIICEFGGYGSGAVQDRGLLVCGYK
jgi:hypothetical protein